MLVDLFSIPETTLLFYTNDVKVLIDILVRQLSDLSAGDVVSLSFLLSLATLTNNFIPSCASGISSYVVESYAIQITLNISIALLI